MLKHGPLLSSFLITGWALAATPSKAFVQITLTETSSGVNATVTGSANLTGLISAGGVTFNGTAIGGSVANQTDFITILGSSDSYTGLTGPASFGPGIGTIGSWQQGGTLASGGGFGLSASGFPILGNPGTPGVGLALPRGYTSGSDLNASASWSGTLASLGLTPGSYDWTWGTEPDQRVNLSIVPVPAPLPIFGAAAAFGYSRKLRKRIKDGKSTVATS